MNKTTEQARKEVVKNLENEIQYLEELNAAYGAKFSKSKDADEKEFLMGVIEKRLNMMAIYRNLIESV